MDLEFFLRPLLGMAFLCDCHRGLGCHVHTLLRVIDRVFPLPGACVPHFGCVSGVLPLEPAVRGPIEFPEVPRHDNMSDSDDSGPEGQIVSNSSRPEEISRIDETRRGSFNSLSYGRERPAWPASWTSLVLSVRLLGVMCFWDKSFRE